MQPATIQSGPRQPVVSLLFDCLVAVLLAESCLFIGTSEWWRDGVTRTRYCIMNAALMTVGRKQLAFLSQQ